MEKNSAIQKIEEKIAKEQENIKKKNDEIRELRKKIEEAETKKDVCLWKLGIFEEFKNILYRLSHLYDIEYEDVKNMLEDSLKFLETCKQEKENQKNE